MIGQADDVGIGDGAQQIPNQIVEFDVGDQVRGLLVAHRAAEHARKPEQRMAAASQTVGFTVRTDQFALDAECGGLQWDKTNVLKGIAVQRLPKH